MKEKIKFNKVYVYNEGLCEDNEILDTLIKENEVADVINKLKLNKSPGIDRIKSNFVKNAKTLFRKILTTLYNQM